MIISILEIVCGIAILFLLKFIQVLRRELQAFSKTQAVFRPTRGEYAQEKGSSRFNHQSPGLRNPGRVLPDLRGRGERALPPGTPADRGRFEGGTVLRGRTGGFHSRKPRVQGMGALVEQAHDHQERTPTDLSGPGTSEQRSACL